MSMAVAGLLSVLIPSHLPPEDRAQRGLFVAIAAGTMAFGGLVAFFLGRMFLLPILAEQLGGFQEMATSGRGRMMMFALMGVCALPVGLSFPLMNGALVARSEAQGRGVPVMAMWISTAMIMGVFIGGYMIWMATQIPH